MKKIIILRALAWGRDSRVERWAYIYSKRYPLFGIWGKSSEENNIYSITNIIRNPKNKFLILAGYIWFSLKCFYFVLKHAKKGDKVICIDLETILFSYFAAKIKRIEIHYDIADPFFLAKPIYGKKLWKQIEKLFINYSDIVSVPLEIRSKVFFNEIPHHVKIVENVPIVQQHSCSLKQKNTRLSIGYFGVLEKHVRGIEDLISIVEKNINIELIIAGDGNLSDFILKKSCQYENIKFLGTFEHKSLITLAENIDIYFAYYSPLKALHHIASPNKYYEHLYLGKPIIISNIVPQSKEVIVNATGWVIHNTSEDLVNCLNEILKDKLIIKEFSLNCQKVWQLKYENYYSNLRLEFN